MTYYIGTGAKNNYYTLRQRTENGTCACGVREYDYHIRNLSIDREEAIRKAHEQTGIALTTSIEVVDIGTRQAVDWSIFQAGKYTGKSIHEVREMDTPYLVWLCENENLSHSAKYSKTVELTRVLVAKELEENASSRLEEERARKEYVASAQDMLKTFRGVEVVSTHREVGWGYVRRETPLRRKSEGCAKFVETIENGGKASDGLARWAIEDVLKSGGNVKTKTELWDMVEGFVG